MPDSNQAHPMRRDRGKLYPAMDLAVTLAPELMAHFYEVMKIARLEGDREAAPDVALGPKWRELVTVAILATLRSSDGLRMHIKRALDLGATPNEIVETVEPCLVTTGAPSFLAALGALYEVLAERGEIDAVLSSAK